MASQCALHTPRTTDDGNLPTTERISGTVELILPSKKIVRMRTILSILMTKICCFRWHVHHTGRPVLDSATRITIVRLAWWCAAPRGALGCGRAVCWVRCAAC